MIIVALTFRAKIRFFAMKTVQTLTPERMPLVVVCQDSIPETAYRLCATAWRQLQYLERSLQQLPLNAACIPQLKVQIASFQTFLNSESNLIQAYREQQFPKNLSGKTWLRSLKELSRDICTFARDTGEILELLSSTSERIRKLDPLIEDQDNIGGSPPEWLGIKKQLLTILHQDAGGEEGIRALKLPLHQLALKTDRLQVQFLAEHRDWKKLQKWGAIRYSRSLSNPPLYKTHYALREEKQLRVLRYIHNEDGIFEKGRLSRASSEAKVYLLLDEQGQPKFLRRKAKTHEKGQKASTIARKLRNLHPNLLPGTPVLPREHCHLLSMSKIWELIMPRMGTDLEEPTDRMKFRNKVFWVGSILKEVLQALIALHEEGWVHGDIKPANTLLTLEEEGQKPTIKICDFGLSQHVEPGQHSLFSGTPAYLAPDFVNREAPLGPEEAAKTDVFSVAVMAWEMLTGHEIDHTEMWQDALKQDRVVTYGDLEDWGYPSAEDAQEKYGELGALIHSMLNPDPAKRPSSQQALELLERFQPQDLTIDEMERLS